jgi:hypothetical protein
VLTWTRILDSYGINCICFTDNLQYRYIFNVIHKYLKVIHKPHNNKNIIELYDTIVDADFIKKDNDSYEFLKKAGSPFISFDPVDLPTSQLIQLYMDILYWLEFASIPPSELILKLTQGLFSDPLDKSNGYMLSVLADKFRREQSNERYKSNFDLPVNLLETSEEVNSFAGLPEIIKYFNTLQKQKRVKAFRFFEKDENDLSKSGYVQIMTVHKSKGMEFDNVFVPHIWENRYYYATMPENVLVDTASMLEMQLAKIANSEQNQEDSLLKLKQNQIEETLRLLYVAITRARKRLYLTSSNSSNHNYDFGKGRKETPSRVITHFLSNQNADLELSGKNNL